MEKKFFLNLMQFFFFHSGIFSSVIIQRDHGKSLRSVLYQNFETYMQMKESRKQGFINVLISSCGGFFFVAIPFRKKKIRIFFLHFFF